LEDEGPNREVKRSWNLLVLGNGAIMGSGVAAFRANFVPARALLGDSGCNRREMAA